MKESAKLRRISVARKIGTIIFLPIIIGIWMIGWTLAQIGNSGEQIEINQKVLQTHRKLETTEIDTESTETEIDDRRITNEPISA
jgi:hypothetical protein